MFPNVITCFLLVEDESNQDESDDVPTFFSRTFLWTGHSGFLTRIPAAQCLLRQVNFFVVKNEIQQQLRFIHI